MCYAFIMKKDWHIVDKTAKEIAKKVRNIRRAKKISQENLWLLSSVSLGSIKRFERTGNISLVSLIKILVSLDCLDQFLPIIKSGE